MPPIFPCSPFTHTPEEELFAQMLHTEAQNSKLACKLAGHPGKMRWLTIQSCLSTEEKLTGSDSGVQNTGILNGIARLVLNAANDGRSTQRSIH